MSAPASRPVRRLGVYGGTFDPIHLGHLRAAEEAREQLGLERVLFVPSGDPPHKRRPLASAGHRLTMVRRAVAANPWFRVSTIEVDRRGRSYTIDTLHAVRAHVASDMALTLLIGLDAFAEIGTWKRYTELFALADLAVWSRPRATAHRLRALLPVAARADFCYGPDHQTLVHRTGNQIRFLSVTAFDVSASDIRSRVQRGLSIRYLVPRSVERYITRHALYAGRQRSF